MNKRHFTLLSLLALLLILAAAQFGWIDSYIQSVLLFMGINIILCSSLNLVNGYMGEFSCGHAGFMAIGAYVSSLMNIWLFVDHPLLGVHRLSSEYLLLFFPITLFMGALAAALFSLLVAVPSFKTRGDYLAIITIAINFIIKNALENMESIGGSRGFMGMQQIVDIMQQQVGLPWMMIWVMLAMLLTLWLIHRFVSSTYGKGVLAIQQDEIAAEIMGIPTNKIKIIVFMLSSGLAGLAGGLYGHVVGYINPGSFSLLKSTECMIMVYLGGMGSLSGSVLSAILFTLLLEVLRPLQIIKWVVLPLLLILLMYFRPSGLMGNREISDWWKKKHAKN
jgi:branched-chain amino acid transport system permease protein